MFEFKKLATILGVIGLFLINGATAASNVVGAKGTPENNSSATDCSIIYDGGNGWTVDMCATDSSVTTPMQVWVDGVSKGSAVVVRIYHESQYDSGTPQVAVLYSSGFVRLKQNADPTPSIPFGTSFILGPAYWPNSTTYYHNPQLTRLELDTTWLPNAPLRMLAQGTNHDFAMTYEMTLPPPLDRQTRLHVTQTYTATANINIDATRLAEEQGFKLVQESSMYINEGAPCDGGYTDCHDSNDLRYIASDLNRRQQAFDGLVPPSFILTAPRQLGTTWLDALHKDDQGWQSQTGAGTSGNTPNVRIALDELLSPPPTVQGWISATADPNQDNVNLWLHDNRTSSASWTIGESDQIGYWLLAQDNPPDPWADLGLRPGTTFLNFNGGYNCYPVKDPAQDTTAEVTPGNGYNDRDLRLIYNLGNANGNWTQIRCDFDPPLDLSGYDHLRFEWQGGYAGNSLEVGLIDSADHIFARGYHHVTHHTWWGQMVIPFQFLQAWTPGTEFNPAQVKAFFVSVVKDPVDDVGGDGAIAIDNLGAFNVVSRSIPSDFETIEANRTAAQAAVNWLASQQQPTGLVKSWQEESTCVAHTYDQALALIAFSRQGMWLQANSLVDALAATQNPDGSWYKSRNCITLTVVDGTKWEGDIAWAIYALRRYLDWGGTNAQAPITLQKGADYLALLVDQADGCYKGSLKYHTEGTIDAWWAFQAAGAGYTDEADNIKNCLLTHFWDDSMGRFKGGWDWWQPYLDNQTWGAAFLKAIGETNKALRALSYARDVLRVPAQGGQLFGFDGQGGPWSVWNEGTAQYAALGGEGSRDALRELFAQQEQNGAMPGSPDEFSGGGIWTTRWHGVAPTAWLFNAICDEPFHIGSPVTISGNVGVSGATLSYIDCTPKAVITDDNGNYSFSVPLGWNGTVTPTKPGYVFKPLNRRYTNLTDNQVNQSYTPFVAEVDNDASQWSTYLEGTPTPVLENVSSPSLDGISLRCGIAGGTPYSNVHCYRNLPAEPQSKVFTLYTSFYYQPISSFNNESEPSIVQGLEFTMNKWDQELRYEWALQWENVGDGAPKWRYWDPNQPSQWVDLGIVESIAGEQWHTLVLEGEILDGNVHYQNFIFDGQSHSLDIIVEPAPALGELDRLAVAVQVDGNSTETPYDLFIDHVAVTTASGHVISGNTGVAGTTLRYTINGISKSVTSDANGNYSIIVLPGSTGDVIPSKDGHVFDPVSLSFSNVLSDFTDQNFMVVTWPAWSGGVVVTSDQPVVAVGRSHVGAEVMTYNGFGSGSTTMYVPMLFKNAFGGGYNAALYLQNISDSTSANVLIEYFDSDGALTCSVTGETLTPLAIKGYWLPTVGCLPVGWVGGAVVTSDQPVVAVGRPHIGTQVTTYTGFASGSPSMYVPMLFKNAFAGGSYNAALYIQNTDASLAAIVNIDFYDSDGNLTCSLSGQSMAARATKGYWTPGLACLPVGWVGGAVVSANRDIVAVGRPHIGTQVTTYNGVSGGQTGLRVPMLFKNAFAGGTYNAALYIQNTDPALAATVNIDFYDSNGSLTCSLTGESIAARATKGYWMPSVACLPTGWVGGAVITANRDVVAVGRPHVGAEVATYGGFATGSTEMYLPMLFKDAFGGSYDSAFYVQNTSSGSPANVTFKFYDTLGNLSCLKNASIPAGATVGYWLPTLTCTP